MLLLLLLAPLACRILPSHLHLRRVCDIQSPMSSAWSRGNRYKVTRLCECHIPCLSRSIISIAQMAASCPFRVHSRPLCRWLHMSVVLLFRIRFSLPFIPSLYQKVCGRVLRVPPCSFISLLLDASQFIQFKPLRRSLVVPPQLTSTSLQYYKLLKHHLHNVFQGSSRLDIPRGNCCRNRLWQWWFVIW